MSFYDFPHTQEYDRDLGFLIKKYKELLGMYAELIDIYSVIESKIKETTEQQLQEWLSDGTFAEIINEEIFNELNSKVDTNTQDIAELKTQMETFASEFEELKKEVLQLPDGSITAALDARTFNNYIPNLSDTPAKGYLQGMCVTDTSYIIAILPVVNTVNYGWLVEIAKGTSSIIKEKYLQIYHANALAYNKEAGEVYIACNSSVAGDSTVPNNNVIIVDYASFNIKDTKTLPTQITASNRVRSVSYDNEKKTLLVGDVNKCWFLSADWSTVEKEISLQTADCAPNDVSTTQAIKHGGQYIARGRMNPNGIELFDLDGKLIKQFFDLDVQDGIVTGEFEDVCIEGDYIYFSTCQTSRSGSLAYTFDYTIFKTRLSTGYYHRHIWQTQKTNNLQVYCDPTSTQLQIGTKSNPLGTPNQALFLDENIRLGGIQINAVSTADYGWYATDEGKQSYLNGGGKMTLHGLINRGGNLVVGGVLFDCNGNVNLNTEANPTTVHLYDNHTTIFKSSCKFTGSNGIKNAILNADGRCAIQSCSFTGFVYALQVQTNGQYHLYNNSFSSCTYYYRANTPDTAILDGAATTWNNCDPEGYLPDVVSNIQAVKFDFSDGVATVKNPKAVVNKLRIFTLAWQYQGTTTHYTTQPAAGYVNLDAGFATDSYVTKMFASIQDNDAGKFTLSARLLQQAVSGGAWSNMSDKTTFTITGIRVLP